MKYSFGTILTHSLGTGTKFIIKDRVVDFVLRDHLFDSRELNSTKNQF